MKRILAMVMLLGALFVARAEAVDLGVFGAYWSQKDADEVFGAGATLAFDDLPIEVRGTWFDQSSGTHYGDLTVIPVDAGLVIHLINEEVRLAVIGGGSYFIFDADGDVPDNEWGWYAGGRLEVPLSGGADLFGDVMYRGAELNDSDIDLSGISVDVGFLF